MKYHLPKLNYSLEKYPKLADRILEDLMKNLPSLDLEEKDRTIFKCGNFSFWERLGLTG